MNKELLKYAIENGVLSEKQAVYLHYGGLLIVIALLALMANEAFAMRANLDAYGCAAICSCKEIQAGGYEIVTYPPYSANASHPVPQSYYDYTGKQPQIT